MTCPKSYCCQGAKPGRERVCLIQAHGREDATTDVRPLPKEEGEASGAVKIGAHPETVSHQQLLREKERKLRGVALGGEAVDQKFTQGRLSCHQRPRSSRRALAAANGKKGRRAEQLCGEAGRDGLLLNGTTRATNTHMPGVPHLGNPTWHLIVDLKTFK